MGTAASAEADDGAWDERAWADGVPFTLLPDDAFVAEKFQELARGDDAGDELETTGAEELPKSELERMADAARAKLFAVRWDAGLRGDGEPRKPVSALLEMEGTALARVPRQWLAIERRREKQCEIAWDYMTRLARRMERRARTVRQREKLRKQSQMDDASRGAATADPRLRVKAACAGLGGSHLFSVASFRMQLEMLRAFRLVSPAAFESGVLSLVQTILDFPAFALHGSQDKHKDDNGSDVSVALIEDTDSFVRSLLPLQDLSAAHRGVLLVLRLALGVSSGRAQLLLEFVANLLSGKANLSSETALSEVVGGRSVSAWIDELLGRLETYRIHYELGTLSEDTFLKEINIKTIKDDAEASTGGQEFSQPASIATDGTYVYTWSLHDGLAKIGTGLNFTVAGRVYARAPSQQFLRYLREKRLFHCGFYGSGVDATARVQEALLDPSSSSLTKPIGELIEVENGETRCANRRRLFVQLNCEEKRSSFVVTEQETLGSALEAFGRDVRVVFAFFGEFVMISDTFLRTLNDSSAGKNWCKEEQPEGIRIDSVLLQEVCSDSTAERHIPSVGCELVLVYSTPSSGSRLFLEKFELDEVISLFEDYGQHVYFTSMILCGDQIFLSLLHPCQSDVTQTADTVRHRPRPLHQISTADFSYIGMSSLSADDNKAPLGLSRDVRASQPLFTYVTEGRYIYEVEMSAECFRVRVFSQPNRSKGDPVYIKSFDVDLQQVQCPTFVSCLLRMLKMELRVGHLDFVLPSFFTNGAFLCILLPSNSPTGSLDRTQMMTKFDCLMFSCEEERFMSIDPKDLGEQDLPQIKIPEKLRSFERALPSSSCCFDALNNVVWIFNISRATLSSYRNTGRCIPRATIDDDEDLQLASVGLSVLNSDAVALRVLLFLVKYATENGNALRGDSVENSVRDPFSVRDENNQDFSYLLDLAECLATYRDEGFATDTDLQCLRCSLILMREATRSLSSSQNSIVNSLHSRLPNLLVRVLQKDGLVYSDNEQKQNDDNRQQLELAVSSAAVALSAETSHLVEVDLDAQFDHALVLVKKWRTKTQSRMETSVTSCILKQLRKSIETASEVDPLSSTAILDRFSDLWVEFVSNEVAHVSELRDGDRHCVGGLGDSVHVEFLALVNFFVQQSFIHAFADVDQLKMALRISSQLCRGIRAVVDASREVLESNRDTTTVEKVLFGGIIRRITPTIFVNMTVMLRKWVDAVQIAKPNLNDPDVSADKSEESMREELGSWLQDCNDVVKLYQSLGELGKLMNAESQSFSVATVARTTKTEVMESSHDYENSLDIIQELKIPGATQITITFDPRSRTELSYDYVTFYKDKTQTSFYGEQFYSGRDTELNWPGVGGRQPLIINSDHCYVYFHTDASNTDWGYKFTAVGELFEKTEVIQRHWLTSLSEMVLGFIDEAGRLLVEGTVLLPICESEGRNSKVLQSELLRHGVAAQSEQDAGVTRFLRDFIAPSGDSEAAKVLVALEQESRKTGLRAKSTTVFDNPAAPISQNPINVAIRAAYAAILHHNMWGMDAFAFAKNMRSDVSEQLLRGWKNAQKMREWFHLGDAADAAKGCAESPSSRGSRKFLRRQPSAYKGLTDEALDVLCRNVVKRATFLLEMVPMSFSYVSGAKRRWNFIAKYGSALGVTQQSLTRSTSNSTLGKWYSLLDELQEATELRSLLHYRRSSSERRKSKRMKSVTEQVLEFIQSDVDVEELRQLLSIRNKRAEYRSCGLFLYANVAQLPQPVRHKLLLAESCSQSLRKVALEWAHAISNVSATSNESAVSLPALRLHFASLLSGCDSELRKAVDRAFGACLSQYVSELESDQTFDPEYMITLIKAICIDYDIDDAYLLQERNILHQLLRLLATKASRIRRSAHVLFEVLLSRLAVLGDSGSGRESTELTQFQKQLFAAVGLQLEGISSRVRDYGASTCSGLGSWIDRPFRLDSLSSGLVAPATNNCNVRWNHSIMLWIFVSSALVSYSLKVGDEVRRGPSCQSEVSGEIPNEASSIGVVVAITGPKSVRVKWPDQDECECVFDPKEGRLEVILASESIGGVVFCKGSKTLVKDSGLAAPWSHFGLFLNDRRQLSYRISCGDEKECVYDTDYELDYDSWAHVAIIQSEEVLKFYVNGLVVSQHVLDPFLVVRSSSVASESKIVKSDHPVTGAADLYWPVHIPGASKIRITFDPLSEIDQTAGFVRFYKNARCNEVWGEDKYTGRYHDPERNFPGALSNRHRGRRSLVAAIASQSALEIPCDRFLVYFRHSGDSTCWGFRFLATPYFSITDTSEQPCLNSYPFIFGAPPARVMDATSAHCWVYQPTIINLPLEEDEIVDQMQAPCPGKDPSELSVERALDIIGLVQTCAETPIGREMISTPENVSDLMLLAFEESAPAEIRCASAMVLKLLVGNLSVDFVSEQFQRIYPGHEDIVSFIFSALARAVNCWAHSFVNEGSESAIQPDDVDPSKMQPVELQRSVLEAQGLVGVYASLLRRMAMSDGWLTRVCECIEGYLRKWEVLISFGQSNTIPAAISHARWNHTVGEVIAGLEVIGGKYSGVSVGSRVRCCASVDSKETTETGYLLRFQDHDGPRTARVLFDCDPTNPVDVPVADVSHLSDEEDEELALFLQEVSSVMFSGAIPFHLTALMTKLRTDMPHEVVYRPKMSRKENVEVLESEHPYAGGEDVTYPLFFHGVQEIVIYFDEMSSTNGLNDYISFMKRDDDNRSPTHVESNNGKLHWGEDRYFGGSFPGVKGAPPLRIPASSVDVRFRTELSSVEPSEWGFKLTAHAFEETTTLPPEVPPTQFVNAMNDIRARSVKAVFTCIQAQRQFPQSDMLSTTLQALTPRLLDLANAIDDGRQTQWPTRSQTFESKHPYSNSVRECMTVTFSGAERLIITFDPRTKTELDNDCLTFFRDQSLKDRWGAKHYSGDDERANWPGLGERPPLVIPSDTFTMLWVTDASNVDWGWRFDVSVEYPVITPLSLRLNQLNKHAQDIWEIFHEGIGPQRIPFTEEYEGYEKFSSVAEWETSKILEDSPRHILFEYLNEDKLFVESVSSPLHTVFYVTDADGVAFYESPCMNGAPQGRFGAGQEFIVSEQSGEWLKTSLEGRDLWVKRRSKDKLHAARTASMLQNEDVLVVGVDDNTDLLFTSSHNFHLDEGNTESETLTMFISQFAVDALKGQSARFQSFAYDTHRAIAIKYARETLKLLLLCSNSELSRPNLHLRDFGSPKNFLLLLTRILNDRHGSVRESAIDDGLQCLFISSKTDEDCSALIDQCLSILEQSKTLLPSTRGVVRTLESAHPYADDMDHYWQLSIPGARKVLVYFDPRSKTEESCDWLCFYKNGTDRSVVYGESMYHGRNGSENWPGFGGRPPLEIDADNFEVYFHSDPNQNDWGFKLSAIGVFGTERDSSVSLEDVKQDDLVELMQLAFKVLTIAAKACLSTKETTGGSDLVSAIFSRRVVEVLSRGIEDYPKCVRPMAFQLIHQLVQNSLFVHSLPSNMIEEVQTQLRSKLRVQLLAEERSEIKSEYLQALVECSLSVDLAVDSNCFTPIIPFHRFTTDLDMTSVDSTELPLFRWLVPPVDLSTENLHIRLLLRSASESVSIKISLLDSDTSGETLLEWGSDGKIEASASCGSVNVLNRASLCAGDTLLLYVDLLQRIIVLRKNSLCVFSSTGLDLKTHETRVGVTIASSSKHNQFTAAQVYSSPLAYLPTSVMPNWYNRARDALSLLLDFDERRVGSLVECDSEHPLPVNHEVSHKELVEVPGAVALEVRFDRRSVLHDRHRLRFAPRGDCKGVDIVGICGAKREDLFPELFMNDSLKRTGILKPRDRVIRANDWCYDNEDGGPGCIGIVEELVQWNGRNGCGVRVKWTGQAGEEARNSSAVGVYRYGYDGYFDVQLLRQPTEWDEPLVIPGDALEYSLDCIPDDKDRVDFVHNETELFQGTLCIASDVPNCTLGLDIRKTKWLLGDECTTEFWVLIRENAFCGRESSPAALVLLEIVTLDPARGLLIGVKTEGSLCILTRTEESAIEIEPSHVCSDSVVENQWVHIAIVFSASKVLLYANGDCATEAALDTSLLMRNLYVSSLRFGGQSESSSTQSSIELTSTPFHLCEVRVWDAALRREQLQSHASGVDSSIQESIGWQSSTPPQAPRKQSHAVSFSQLLLSPSPPRSPRSPSRVINIPPQQRKWITSNRNGRDLVTVRADCVIPDTSNTLQGAFVYYEAHVLSAGKVCVGFAGVNAKPSSREDVLGVFEGGIGFELPHKRVRFKGINSTELEEAVEEGLNNPRRRSSSSGGGYFGDLFAREGDVVGCAYGPTSKTIHFFLNGELLAQLSFNDDASLSNVELPDQALESPLRLQRQFDSLVGEMLSMGFSRQASQDALEATANFQDPTVPRAVDWLLDETTGRDSASISSPRRLTSSSPLVSPRRRTSSSGAPSQKSIAVPASSYRHGCLVPAATLGASGAQGIAWNLGQRPFKYAPTSIAGKLVSALAAANRVESEDDAVGFEVFDHDESKWVRVMHRHRIQEIAPTVLARWRLDEGFGCTVYDSSGRDQVGTIQFAEQHQAPLSGPVSPRSKKSGFCWDANSVPPVAVIRGRDVPFFREGSEGQSRLASKVETVWGYRFYVIPHFSVATIGRRRFQTQANRFIIDGPAIDQRHDQQIVKYVNKVATSKQMTLSQVLRAPWSELSPNESDLVKWPVLVEVATGVAPVATSADAALPPDGIKASDLDRLGKQFGLIQELNSMVSRLLPFIAFGPTLDRPYGFRLDALIREQRCRIFHAVKQGLWGEALKRTKSKTTTIELILNRPKAMRHRVSGKVDAEGRFALFSQAFRQLNVLHGQHFRRATPIYHVHFLGENAQDAGGPYRETFAQYADELHSSQLPLLIASSNAQHNVGAAREKWVLNPSATSETHIQMLEFLGKLMGVAIRSQEYFSLQIALLIWKQLAGERVTVDDLALVDSMIVSSMQKIRTIDQYGVTAEMFEDIVMETFTTLSTDNRIVPLKPHGASIAVTFDSRVEFADLVDHYRLHEFDVQATALLRGLAKVVPPRLLSLFTGAELEQLVCGSPEVDVDLLLRCTEYSSCSPDDDHIVWFWQVLREFSHEERSTFLRFVWGRSRLPANEKEFPQRFKLQSFNKTIQGGGADAADAYLPIAHTCFFSVELPRYSSIEVLKEKLTYAMYNCQEIDGDGDSVMANQLGWEE